MLSCWNIESHDSFLELLGVGFPLNGLFPARGEVQANQTGGRVGGDDGRRGALRV